MLTTLIFILLVYLAGLAYFYFCQRALIYYPQPGAFVYQDHAFELTIDGVNLRGWVLNEGCDSVLFYFGGNNENIQMNISRFERWFPQYTVYLVNYRGYGKSDGAPSETALFNDALSLYDRFAEKYNTIGVIGRSLGSGVACHLASMRRVDKLALITPYDSINNVGKNKYWYMPVQWLLHDKFESWKKVDKISAHTIVFTAIGDEVIPNPRTENLLKYFKQTKPRVIEVEETTHGLIMNHARFSTRIKDFFELSAFNTTPPE